MVQPDGFRDQGPAAAAGVALMEAVNEYWLCNQCGQVKLDTAGRCEKCGSDAVAPIMPEKKNEGVVQRD